MKKTSKKTSKKTKSRRWPDERDVLFRPGRYKYVRKMLKTEGCVFCDAEKVEPSLESLCVYKSKSSMILLNKFPYNNGHLLVIPRRHSGDLLDLSADEYECLHRSLRLSIEILKDVYEPQGMNLGMNLGQVSGAGIPDHLHYHVIPRWSGDLNFFPLISKTKVVVQTLEETYLNIMSYLKKRNL